MNPKTPVSKRRDQFRMSRHGATHSAFLVMVYVHIIYTYIDIRDRDLRRTRRQTVAAAAITVSYLTIFWRHTISRWMDGIMVYGYVGPTKPSQTSLPATRACGSLCQIEMLPHGQTERDKVAGGRKRGKRLGNRPNKLLPLFYGQNTVGFFDCPKRRKS